MLPMKTSCQKCMTEIPLNCPKCQPASSGKTNERMIMMAHDLLEELESHCNLCATDNGIDVENCLPEICNTKKVIAKAHGIS